MIRTQVYPRERAFPQNWATTLARPRSSIIADCLGIHDDLGSNVISDRCYSANSKEQLTSDDCRPSTPEPFDIRMILAWALMNVHSKSFEVW